MTVTQRPKRGRPKAGSDDAAAVAFMESEVVRLVRDEGLSFYRCNQKLGISNSDRIFRRAVEKGRTRTREDAYLVESERLDALHEKAWRALSEQGLDGLAEQIAEILARDYDIGDGDPSDSVPARVRDVITAAYADTLRAVPVLLNVHDRRAKLDGLTHSDRIADAQLTLDQARVTMMATAFVGSLADEGLDAEAQKRIMARWAEGMAALESPDEA